MNRWVNPYFAPVALAVLILALGLTATSTYWLQVWTRAGIFAIAAIAITMLYGGSGQISLGHAGFLGIGAWASGYVTVTLGYGFIPAALLAITGATIAGAVIGYAALRLQGWFLSLGTSAFGLAVAETMRIRLPNGIFGIPPVELPGLVISTSRGTYWFVWLLVLLILVFISALTRSRFGRSLAALRDDPVAAASCGVNLARAKITVFCLSAALTGLAGALFAAYQGSVAERSFEFWVSIDILLMAVVGGLGVPLGAVFGSLFFTVLPETGRAWEDYRLFTFGVLIILVVVFLPRGLIGIGGQLKSAAKNVIGRGTT